MSNFDKVRLELTDILDEDPDDMDLLSSTILTLLNIMHEAGDGNISCQYGWNTIGIDVTKNRVSVVDIEASKELISLKLEVTSNDV
jgi:hypothetical protein